MPTNDEGNTDAQEGAEDKTSEGNNDDDILSSIEDEELREKVQNKIVSEREQKKHWRNKAQKSDSDNADSDSENDETEQAPDADVEERLNRMEENQKLRAEGYSDDEIAEARAYAKGKDISTVEAMETDFVQSALSQMREKQSSQENTPGPSSQVKSESESSFSDVINDEDATEDEKNKALQERVKQHLNQGQTSHE